MLPVVVNAEVAALPAPVARWPVAERGSGRLRRKETGISRACFRQSETNWQVRLFELSVNTFVFWAIYRLKVMRFLEGCTVQKRNYSQPYRLG